jgi:Co/Zn/Cd efflux system component
LGQAWAILAPMSPVIPANNEALRRTVLVVALANLAYFFVEFAVARHIGSVALFADSIDFLEDTAVNLLVFFALAWSAIARARVGMLLAAVLLVPAVAALWTAWQKFNMPVPPDPLLLSLAGIGALLVNLTCALLLARHRRDAGSLAKAAFLSARNDAFANVAIIAAALATLHWVSGWPDLAVGLGIAAMNANAAMEVWEAARGEARSSANA